MTLSLDDVRNKRFRMARKSGYEVLEVDEFVDEVEETFGQLISENQNLKKQVEALKSAPQQSAPSSGPATPVAPVVQQPPPPAAVAAPADRPPVVPIVVTTAKEASSAVVRLVEMSTEQSERLVNEATEEANRIREEATRNARQVGTDARTQAERVESEARINAERLHADALGRAEQLDREIDSRRTEMFGSLEKQRDELTSTVAALRTFEASFRANLTSHLRTQIETLESGRAEPANAPEALRESRPAGPNSPGGVSVSKNNGQGSSDDRPRQDRDDTPTMGGGSSTSDTPRLDALLGDQR